MSTLNIDLLKDSVCFTLTMRHWGNRRQDSAKKLNQNAKQCRLSKQLIDASEYDAIRSFQNDVYLWCVSPTKGHAVPSFFKEGIYLVAASEVDKFEAKLKESVDKLRNELVPALLAAYPKRIDEAQGVLEPLGLFDKNDYPDAENLRGRFNIEWNWISFDVPQNIPSEVRKVEVLKIENAFKAAETQISLALQEGFQGILSHIVDRLSENKNGDKPRIFRDSLFEDLTGFISTFSTRNLVNDTKLAELVEKANSILSSVRGNDTETKAQAVRESGTLKEQTAKAFEALKQSIDQSIVEKKSRKFNFDNE